MNTAVLLISTGSPNSYKPKDVARYLNKFLNSRRIINLPSFARYILVNGMIVPCRFSASAKRYKMLAEMYNGQFPLPLYCNMLKEELEKNLPVEVFTGMCYGKPFIEDCLQTIINKKFNRIIVLPLHPHYTSAATGIPVERVLTSLAKYPVIPEIVTVNSFHTNAGFINSFAQRIREYDYKSYDNIIFSYHSLPLQHIHKYDTNYPELCRETTRLICNALGIDECCTCFQSSMDNKWLGPSAESVIIKKAQENKTKLLVVSPSFVVDCLETDIEIGVELKEIFLKNGGKELVQVKSLNNLPIWIKALKSIIEDSCVQLNNLKS